MGLFKRKKIGFKDALKGLAGTLEELRESTPPGGPCLAQIEVRFSTTLRELAAAWQEAERTRSEKHTPFHTIASERFGIRIDTLKGHARERVILRIRFRASDLPAFLPDGAAAAHAKPAADRGSSDRRR